MWHSVRERERERGRGREREGGGEKESERERSKLDYLHLLISSDAKAGRFYLSSPEDS